MKTEYSVIVSNIGQVYCGAHINEALRVFIDYVDTSVRGRGRGGDESVYLMRDGEPFKEFLGKQQQREDL